MDTAKLKQDRAKLEARKRQKFEDRCRNEFAVPDLVERNRRRVEFLSTASYVPNVFSGLSLGFFVIYVVSGYQPVYAVILGAVLLLLIVIEEKGKRTLISEIAHDHFLEDRINYLAVAVFVVVAALSMIGSYIGGNQLVVATASPPPMEVNPRIAEIDAALKLEAQTVDKLQKTTWKGKVTTRAQDGIKSSKSIQEKLVAERAGLVAKDEAIYAPILQAHEAKKFNLGVVTGIIAALADLALFLMLWSSKRMKYEVADLKSSPSGSIGFRSAHMDAISEPVSQNSAQQQIGFKLTGANQAQTHTAKVANIEAQRSQTSTAKVSANPQTLPQTPEGAKGAKPLAKEVCAPSVAVETQSAKVPAKVKVAKVKFNAKYNALPDAEKLRKAKDNLRAYQSLLRKAEEQNKSTESKLAGIDRWEAEVVRLENKLSKSPKS